MILANRRLIIDKLIITDLLINTHIGVHAWEQRILQPLKLNITIPLDLNQLEDRLDQTIDYADLCDRVTTFVASNRFALIETVAKQVAQLIKETFHVTELTVSVSKPHAVAQAANIEVVVG